MKENHSIVPEPQGFGSVCQNTSSVVPGSETVRIPLLSIDGNQAEADYLEISRPFQGIGMAYSVADNGCFVSSLIHAESAKGWGMILWEDLLGKHPLQLKERFHQMKDEGVLPEGASFRLVNFNPFLISDRVNPIQCRYIRTMDDALQTASSFLSIAYHTFHIEGDLNRYRSECENLLAAAIYFLVNYDLRPYDANGELLRSEGGPASETARPGYSSADYVNAQGEPVPVHHWVGRYSSLPHVFSLLMRPDDSLLDILCSNPETAGLVSRLRQALRYAQFSVLDRVVGTLRTVVSRFMDPKFYWVLSGDDFDLNVSSAEHPVYLSMSVGAEYESSENAISCFVLERIVAETAHKSADDRPCSVILADYPSSMVRSLKHWISSAKHNRVSYTVGLRSSHELSSGVGPRTANFLFRHFGTLVSSSGTSPDTSRYMTDLHSSDILPDGVNLYDYVSAVIRPLTGPVDCIGGVTFCRDACFTPFLGRLKPVWECPSAEGGEIWRHTALDIFREDCEVANERYLQNYKRIESDVEELYNTVCPPLQDRDYVNDPVMGRVDKDLYMECLQKL